MKNLYKFEYDAGRMGVISGMFLANPDDVANLMGKSVGFSEVLGKHSYISAHINQENLFLLTDDQEWLNKAVELDIDLNTGTNPFEWYEQDEEDN